MTMQNKICVIVPIYNTESYVKDCINSILAQTFNDLEILLIDDGSTDNCGKICDEYAESDDRIVVIHQANKGVAIARNAGIDWAFQNSQAKYLCFVDSDDRLHPQAFAILNDSFHVVSTLRRFGRSACNYFDRCALIYAGNWSLSFNSSYGKI